MVYLRDFTSFNLLDSLEGKLPTVIFLLCTSLIDRSIIRRILIPSVGRFHFGRMQGGFQRVCCLVGLYFEDSLFLQDEIEV